MHIADIRALLTEDIAAVESLVLAELHPDIQHINTLGKYLIESGGKRIRPLLVLLAAKALGYGGNEHVRLAAVVEFIHTATLLHDDVVDTSDLRRGKKSANAVWGNASCILVGDYLFSRAFQMMVLSNSLPIMLLLANTSNAIAAGEIRQLLEKKNMDLTETAYLEIIQAKTAILFAAAAEIGALLTQQSAQVTEAFRQYGLNLGIAFQLADDILDYVGDADAMGKNLGDDLQEGKLTLPIIYTLQQLSPEIAKKLKNILLSGDKAALDFVAAQLKSVGAIQYAYDKAQFYAQKAIETLNCINDSPYKAALCGLAQISVGRNK